MPTLTCPQISFAARPFDRDRMCRSRASVLDPTCRPFREPIRRGRCRPRSGPPVTAGSCRSASSGMLSSTLRLPMSTMLATTLPGGDHLAEFDHFRRDRSVDRGLDPGVSPAAAQRVSGSPPLPSPRRRRSGTPGRVPSSSTSAMSPDLEELSARSRSFFAFATLVSAARSCARACSTAMAFSSSSTSTKRLAGGHPVANLDRDPGHPTHGLGADLHIVFRRDRSDADDRRSMVPSGHRVRLDGDRPQGDSA